MTEYILVVTGVYPPQRVMTSNNKSILSECMLFLANKIPHIADCMEIRDKNDGRETTEPDTVIKNHVVRFMLGDHGGC